MAKRTYRHLTLEERETISLGLAQGRTLRELADELKRAPSTLSRECRRNGSTAPGGALYWGGRARPPRPVAWRVPDATDGHASSRAPTCGTRWGGWPASGLVARADCRAPQACVASPHDPPGLPRDDLSRPLRALPRGEFRRELIACLRQGRKRHHPRSRGEDRRGQIPNLVSIHERPAEVEARRVPGHWEGNLVKGSRSPTVVGTLVERRTRLGCWPSSPTAPRPAPAQGCPQVLAPAGRPAPHAHLRPGQGDGASRGTHRAGEDPGVPRRSPQPLAAGHERKHQRIPAPVPAQGNGPVGGDRARAQPYRLAAEHTAAKDPRLGYTA